MKGRNLAFGLFILLVFAIGCNPSPTPGADIACDPSGCISLSKFSTNISNALQGKVVGYVSIVGSLPPVFSGQARTSSDTPSMAMLPDMLTDVASVSKVLTTIAVLQSLAKHNLTIDDKISPYIWPDWFKGDNIDTITFRDLLTHKSGFRMNCGGSNTTYAVLQQQIAIGVDLYDKTIPSYNNCNFAIFRELLLFMEGYTWSFKPQTVEAQTSATFYINYMNQHVFAPLGIPTRECKPSSSATFEILSYPLPAGSTHGDDWGDWTLACGGGGWVLSAGDLYKIVNDLANGNVLLTNSEKALMNSNCLGWDCSVRNDCPFPSNVCKNGDLDSGSIAIWTYLGIFKCNVPAVVIVNSYLPSPYQPYNTSGTPIPNNGDIIGLVKDAYNNAGVTGTSAPCPILSAQLPRPEVQRIVPTRTSTPLPLAPEPRLPNEPRPTLVHTPMPVPRDTQGPRPPVFVAPIDGTAVDCKSVALTWKPAEDPSGIRDYDVELEKLNDHTFVADKSWNNVKSDSVPFDPACDTHYRWRVRATDNAGNQGAWTLYGFFHVKATVNPVTPPTPTSLPRDRQGPRPPVQTAPLDGAGVDCRPVTLTWNPATDPSGIREYEVEVEQLVDRTYVLQKTLSNLRGTSVVFEPTCNEQYRWRIRATDNAGNAGGWSGFQDFSARTLIQ